MPDSYSLTGVNYIGNNSLKLSTPMLRILVVDYPFQVRENWHFHDKKHALAILKGGNQEVRSTKNTELNMGDVTFYYEGEKHLNRNVAYPSKNVIIEFEDAFFNTHLNFNNLSANPHTFPAFLKVFHESLFPNQDSIENIHQCLYNLLANKTVSKIPPWLIKVKELLNDRWDEFISLHEISKELNLHPVTVSKYFSKYYGYTIADYMRKVKVTRAIRLLLASSHKISEIAYECGFSDQSHMARSFKQYVRFSPKDIRSL